MSAGVEPREQGHVGYATEGTLHAQHEEVAAYAVASCPCPCRMPAHAHFTAWLAGCWPIVGHVPSFVRRRNDMHRLVVEVRDTGGPCVR